MEAPFYLHHSVIHLIKIQFSFCLLQLGRVHSFELASMGHQNSVGPLVGYKHSLSEAAPNTAPMVSDANG